MISTDTTHSSELCALSVLLLLLLLLLYSCGELSYGGNSSNASSTSPRES